MWASVTRSSAKCAVKSASTSWPVRSRALATAVRASAASSEPTYLSTEKAREVTLPTWSTSLSKEAYAHLKDRSYLTQRFDYLSQAAPERKVVYEVTLEVDEDIVDDYLDWVRSGHIQEALALPGFVSWNICAVEGDIAKTKGKDGQKRRVLVENYTMESREALENYFNKYAAPIREDHTRMWDGKFAASRRILEVFGKQSEQEAQLWKDREQRNEFRLRNLKEHVKKLKFFTDVGFKLGRTPAPLWEKIMAFYEENKHKAVREEINPIEVSINVWVSPTYILKYPPDLHEEIISTFKPILEEWSGIPELESTGLSGIRFYQPGALIYEHVDMANTNVISALINIDQKVDASWPFEMRDHSGKMHTLDMSPGDAVIYESSTCAHRRSRPLTGAYFANTFMRFRPKGWTYEYDY